PSISWCAAPRSRRRRSTPACSRRWATPDERFWTSGRASGRRTPGLGHSGRLAGDGRRRPGRSDHPDAVRKAGRRGGPGEGRADQSAAGSAGGRPRLRHRRQARQMAGSRAGGPAASGLGRRDRLGHGRGARPDDC
uniref:Transcriptional regulator, MarR family n=1 Tax=Parastrongyloides trichosuri TaxID=131310 RepID=A0A0N5A5Z6_PARTI